MLISHLRSGASDVMEGTTSSFEIDQGVTDLSIGFLNLPELDSGRLWIKVIVRDENDQLVTHFPRWRTSVSAGIPARALAMSALPNAELPKVSLPEGRMREVSVNVSAKRRLMTQVLEVGAQMYVTAEDAHCGLRASCIKRLG